MSVARSQRFLYFQNKANHYHRLRNIRSSIDHAPPRSHIPKPKIFRPIPFNHEHEIEVQNQQLINRLVTIAKNQRTEVAASGLYSRYNKVDRPFRERSPLREEKQRSITIDNSDMRQRIQSVKPAIGSSSKWDKEYTQFMSHAKNLSRYNENKKSKAELHISTDKFIPQHLRQYALRKESLNSSSLAKDVSIPFQKLFQLPVISRSRKGGDSGLKRQQSQDQLQAEV